MKFLWIISLAVILKVAESNPLESDLRNLETEAFNQRNNEQSNIDESMITGIIGGKNITINKVNYIGVLIKRTTKSVLGSVVIVNEKWVLTAAQIVEDYKAEDLVVRVGSSFADHGGLLVDVDTVFSHVFYERTDNFANNVALLKLKTDLKFSKTIRPISFASKLPKEGVKTLVSGYGYNKSYVRTNRLLQATLPLMDYKKCARYFPYFNITENNVCTLQKGVGPCSFDWGSPIVYQNKLLGIYAGNVVCARPTVPTVYMNILKFETWINITIRRD